MTASNYLYLIATVLALVGWEASVHAEDDVTVVPTSVSATAPAKKQVTSDDTPVVHKSLHKKKKSSSTEVATTSGASAPGSAVTPDSINAVSKPITSPVVVTATTHPLPASTTTQTQSPSGFNPTHFTATVPATTTPMSSSSVSPPPQIAASPVPTVETGLPVARYPGVGTPIKGVSTYIPTAISLPSGKSITGSTIHQTYIASAFPTAVIPMTSSAAGSYSSTPSRTTIPSSDFIFTNFNKRPKNSYPWRTAIITTEFWIGEGGSNVSSTDNVASAWDEDWREKNRGNDSPNDRNGFATAEHASTVNPFYVALPFNDLAFPDKAREFLPSGWYRRPRDGKQVSACKDRWVWIKNAQGRSCFAQWEDVGPLNYADAEYVFGGERPAGMGEYRAGLDISPAVAQYLGIDENHKAITSWRFVDDEDVPPGAWLKYDEQAVIYTALHQLKSATSSTVLPVQRMSQPVEDPDSINSNKKKIDASKG